MVVKITQYNHKVQNVGMKKGAGLTVVKTSLAFALSRKCVAFY